MTNREILQMAMEQSALDINCKAEDFLCDYPVIVRSRLGPQARKYYKEPITCNLVSYGNNIVASVADEYRELIKEYVDKFTFYHCFETPNLNWLSERLLPRDADHFQVLPCGCETRVLGPADFEELYRPEWSNALCEDRKDLDVLGIGAYDGGKLVGLAGASADCDTMWQIGVDVLPEYRRRGVGAALTGKLASEILERGKAPFYCSAWSNIRSVRNAVKSGFIPAWVEITVKPAAVVDEMNK